MDVAQLGALAQDPVFRTNLLGQALRMEICRRHGRMPLTRTKTGLPRTLRFGSALLTVDARHLLVPGGDGPVWLVPVEVERPHERPAQVRYGLPASHPDARSALRAIVAPAQP